MQPATRQSAACCVLIFQCCNALLNADCILFLQVRQKTCPKALRAPQQVHVILRWRFTVACGLMMDGKITMNNIYECFLRYCNFIQVHCDNSDRRSEAAWEVVNQFVCAFKIQLTYFIFRNILWSILIGVPVVTVVYCFMNLSYMTVLSIPEMINAEAVAVVSV